MLRLCRFLAVLTLLSCGSSRGHEVETVPASVLHPSENDSDEPESRVEYKLSDPEKTPHMPAPKHAYHTDSGLQFVVFKRGTSNKHPVSTTNVTVHYEGRTTDGQIFDSSIARGEPSSFVLNQVVPGWREGVKLMTVGDKFRFWIPEAEAYRGQEGRPKGDLIFDVELIEMSSE